MKPSLKDDEKTTAKVGKEEAVNAEAEAAKAMAVDAESQKPAVHKVKNIDLQLDLEKADGGGAGNASVSKLNQPVHKQQQQQSLTEKSGNWICFTCFLF